MRPQAPEALLNMSHVFRNLAKQNPDNAVEMLKQSRDLVKYVGQVSLQSRDESINWSYYDASQLPLPNENTEV